MIDLSTMDNDKRVDIKEDEVIDLCADSEHPAATSADSMGASVKVLTQPSASNVHGAPRRAISSW